MMLPYMASASCLENGVKKNANNANFEYVVAGFRAAKHLGVSFGVLPFTNVGYNYTSTEKVGSQFNDATYTNTYNGEGGLHQVYLGVGWAPVKGLAVGANVAYIWGDYNKYVSNAYSNSNYNTLIRTYSTQLKHLEGFLMGVRKKLSNENFVAHAPEKVVALERKKESDSVEKIAALKATIAKSS